ncbi:cytochrome P450 [Chytriomyces sp. MP71]|nr:cytochrome P450 [Chytriomyces sp. MP71]
MEPSSLSSSSAIATLGVTAFAAYLAIRAYRRSTGTNAENGAANLPWNLPLIGHTFQNIEYERIASVGGEREMVNVSILGMDMLSVWSQEDVKHAFTKALTHWGTSWPSRWVDLQGQASLAVVDDPAQHKRLRLLIGQAISKGNLDAAFPFLLQSAETTVANMVADATVKENVTVLPYSREFTFAAIVSFFFGSRQEDVARMLVHLHNFELWTQGMMDFLLPVWIGGPFARAMVARQSILDTIVQIIQERKEKEQGGDKTDGLAALIGQLEDFEIGDSFITLLFAGYDTTSSAISTAMHAWTFELDASEKELLSKEISAANITDATSLTNLPVLDAFCKEVLRWKSPIPGVFRKAKTDCVLHSGNIVREGSLVNIPFIAMFDNPNGFPEPRKFKLARFLNPSLEDRNAQSYRYVPFGAGPRQCIGMSLARLEMKVFLVLLLKNYRLLPTGKPSALQALPIQCMKPYVQFEKIREE